MSGAAVTISGLDLTPANFTGSRLASLFANWEYFRFVKLRLSTFVSFAGVSLIDSSVSHVTSGGTRTAISFAEDGTAGVTAPTTLEAMAQMSGFAVGAGSQNRCTLSVGASQLLRRELKWWKTDTGGSPPASFLSQGSLWWMYDNDASWSGVGGVITFVLEGICQFQGMTVAGVGLHNSLARLFINGREEKSEDPADSKSEDWVSTADPTLPLVVSDRAQNSGGNRGGTLVLNKVGPDNNVPPFRSGPKSRSA